MKPSMFLAYLYKNNYTQPQKTEVTNNNSHVLAPKSTLGIGIELCHQKSNSIAITFIPPKLLRCCCAKFFDFNYLISYYIPLLFNNFNFLIALFSFNAFSFL